MPYIPGAKTPYIKDSKSKDNMDEFETSPKFQRMRNQIQSLKEDNKILEKSNNDLSDQNQALRNNFAAVQASMREVQCGLFEILNPNLDREQATGEITRLLGDVARYVGGLEQKIEKSRNKKSISRKLPNSGVNNKSPVETIQSNIVEETIHGQKYTHYVYDANVAEVIIALVKRVERLERNERQNNVY